MWASNAFSYQRTADSLAASRTVPRGDPACVQPWWETLGNALWKKREGCAAARWAKWHKGTRAPAMWGGRVVQQGNSEKSDQCVWISKGGNK